MYTVGELSRLTAITVRALHHYDEIGLCSPSARSRSGYRLYGDADLLRLQQVLLFRELGLSLQEIAAALEQVTDRQELLGRHRRTLVAKRDRLNGMIAAMDVALANVKGGPAMKAMKAMKADEVKALFNGFDPASYEAEAEQRWGGTAQYQESARRTKRYGAAEWEEIQREAGAIYAAFAEQMQARAAPSDPAVQALVAQHRAHIDRWFYPCSKEIHRGLGEMYVADPRFTQNIDKTGVGLARFMRDAITAG